MVLTFLALIAFSNSFVFCKNPFIDTIKAIYRPLQSQDGRWQMAQKIKKQ